MFTINEIERKNALCGCVCVCAFPMGTGCKYLLAFWLKNQSINFASINLFVVSGFLLALPGSYNYTIPHGFFTLRQKKLIRVRVGV